MKTFIMELFARDSFIFFKGSLIFLLGPLNLQLAYLLLAIGIDLSFGVEVAIKEKTFKWSIFFSKLRKKLFVYIMWISMFHAFDMIAGLPNTARWAVVVMLAGMELVSAAKNTARLGHGKLADALEGAYLALVKSNPALLSGKPLGGAEKIIPTEPATVSEGSTSNDKDTAETKKA